MRAFRFDTGVSSTVVEELAPLVTDAVKYKDAKARMPS